MVQWLPEDIALEVDVIAHSRGGLVARMLTEKRAEISLGSRSLRIRKVVFIGTPNAGTILADTRYMGHLVDRYTNLLNLFPTNGATDVLGAVIDTVKHLAIGAADRLAGLAAMRPGSHFLTHLNETGRLGGDAEYFTVGSDYEPTHAGLRAYLRNGIMDRIFGTANDLVVPEEGVYDLGIFGKLAVAGKLELDATHGICHSGYFSDELTCHQILGWLGT
jgi:pimeloyl-ACP methyl ester carboxylesterase